MEHPRLSQFVRSLLALLVFGLFANVMSADAAGTYKAKCQMCHAANGAGDTPAGKSLKARDLRLPAVRKQTDAQLAAVIANGKNKMPKFSDKLTKQEIAALVTYIRTLK
jgi:cytochrome c6